MLHNAHSYVEHTRTVLRLFHRYLGPFDPPARPHTVRQVRRVDTLREPSSISPGATTSSGRANELFGKTEAGKASRGLFVFGGIVNFRDNRAARSWPGVRTGREGMQNAATRYRPKHKFLKRCDTRRGIISLTASGLRRSNLREPRNIV